MRNSLFRREVLMLQHDHFFGDPVFHQPLSLRVLLLATIVFFIVLAAFTASASIKQTENVRGFIYAANGEVKVYAKRSGVIQQVHVSNGELVSQGHTLASVTDPGYDQSGEEAKLGFIRHIEQQISQFEDRLTLSVLRQQLSHNQSQSRHTALSEELDIRDDDYHLTEQQLDMAEDEYARLESLRERGAISESELAQGKNTLISIRKSFQNVLIAQQTTRRLVQDSSHEYALEMARLKDERIALQTSLSQLRQRLDEARYEQNFTLIAPVSGRVNNLLLGKGDQIDPRRPFVSIVADKPAYEAQIFVPSGALGKVKTGQTVLLNYDAFPFQQYGSYEAVVSSIATSAIDPREHLIPLDINEPVYLIRAELRHDNDSPGLRAGMQFSAQLVTGQRTILQGIFEPLTSLARRL